VNALAVFSLVTLLAAPAAVDPAITAMYPDPAIAKLVSEYATKGSPVRVAQELKRLRATSSDEALRKALELPIQCLDVIAKRHSDWQKALASRDLPLATRYLEEVSLTEAKVLPKTLKGALLQEMETQTKAAEAKAK